MVNFGVTGGTGASSLQEAGGKFETVNGCIRLNASKTDFTTAAGLWVTWPTGHLKKGTLLTTNTDFTCWDVLHTDLIGGTQEARHVVILAHDVWDLDKSHQQCAAVIEGIWSRDRWYYNGPALTPAEEDLFRQRLIQRWDGI